MVFDKMGIDTNEVVDGMNTKWNAKDADCIIVAVAHNEFREIR